MSGLGAQRGQATVEWVGLLLGVALMLGALVAGGREAAKGESADGLGEAVAERITCAARGECAVARGRGGGAHAPGAHAPGAHAPGAHAPGVLGLERAPGERSPTPQRRAGAGSAPLRGASGVAKRAWMLCLGYRRWRYEVDHALTPRQGVPMREALDMVNDCVNPLSFLFG